MKLDRIIQTITGTEPAANPTTPSQALGSVDPNVDTTGAGVSPIIPETLQPAPTIEAAKQPLPVVVADTYVPPGAPTHSLQVAPVQNLGVSTFALAADVPVRIVPGSSVARRVTITVIGDPTAAASTVRISPDRRQDTTGAQLMNGTAYPIVTGSEVFAVSPGAAAVVSVIIEPDR